MLLRSYRWWQENDWVRSIDGMMLTGVNRSTLGKIGPTANCSTTDPIHTKPRSKLVLTESSAKLPET